MKYKVGDKVRIKSIDWYNENKDNYGAIYAGNGFCFWKSMARLCGEIMKITSVKVDPEDSNKGYYFMENSEEKWTDEMIEGLVEEETKSKYEDEVTGEYYSTPKYLVRPNGYQFVDENGNVINATKIVLEKKKKKYPKTYEECCKIMQVARPTIWFDYDDVSSISKEGDEYECHIENTLCAFRKLLICRDAYWKLYGEENKGNVDYVICNVGGKIISTNIPNSAYNHILIFPTEEMRDAFYENFKELIESVKELL